MTAPWQAVDPLGETLHFLRLDGTLYCRSELRAPWGIAFPPLPDCLMFHMVAAGECWLTLDGAAPRALRPGELALVPHGAGHALASAPGLPGVGLFDLPREAVSERYEILRHGGDGAAATLLCGVVYVGQPIARQLVAALPWVVTVAAGQGPQGEWLRSTLALMAAEARALRPGGETIVTRLADILVIQAIRGWLEDEPSARTGWLGALRDERIGRALAIIHREPAHPWTVAALAAACAMSRSAFAARFMALVGEPPMGYVARWRMQVATEWLAGGRATVGEVALRLGYGSEAAFNRAYKRCLGVTPGAARRAGTPGDPWRPSGTG